MDKRSIQEILRRLDQLEREAVRLRIGTVTARSPLTVNLGESGVSVGADAIGAFNLGDRVAALKFGKNPPLVLGKLRWGFTYGHTTIAFNSNTAVSKDIAHGLGVTPSWVMAVNELASQNAAFNCSVEPVDATNIRARLRHIDALATTGDYGVFWMAIA
ncbi:MAG: hypothetical protein ACRDNE_00695 [Gaiellaceae bacterium]